MNEEQSTNTATLNRIAWQCRRGMRELDDLLGRFLQQRYSSLTQQEQTTFQTLLEYPDAVLLELLMGRMTPADTDVAHLVHAIRDTAAT